MTTLDIIKLVALCVILVAWIIYLVVKGIQNKWFKQLYETLIKAIDEAEQLYPSGHGKEKLQIVLDKIKKKCQELEIPYLLIYKYIIKVITMIIKGKNIERDMK